MNVANSSVYMSRLKPYLFPDAIVFLDRDCLPTCKIPLLSTSMEANSYFFGHQIWGKEYFETSHRHDNFRERWQLATGSWDNKVVREHPTF